MIVEATKGRRYLYSEEEMIGTKGGREITQASRLRSVSDGGCGKSVRGQQRRACRLMGEGRW
jgi:hypothetical protein